MFTYPLNMMNFLAENSRQGMPLKQRYNKYQRISRKGMLLVLVKDCSRTILAIFGIVKLDSDRRSGGKNDAKQLSEKTPRNCQPKVPRGTRSLPTVTELNLWIRHCERVLLLDSDQNRPIRACLMQCTLALTFGPISCLMQCQRNVLSMQMILG